MPAFLFCARREKRIKNKNSNNGGSWCRLFFEYIAGVILCNMILWVLLLACRKTGIDLTTKINTDLSFAVKYLICMLLVAFFLPEGEKMLREHFYVRFQVPSIRWDYFFNIFAFGFCTCCIMLNGSRVFDNVLGCDECIRVLATRMPFREMMGYVSQNGHSPLWYVICWVVLHHINSNFFYYHFLAFFPYLLIMVICFSYIRKHFNSETALIVAMFSSILPNAVSYNVAARMYSWTELFLLINYLIIGTLFSTLKETKIQNYIVLTLTAILAVYSHSFAIPCVGLMYLGLFIYALRIKDKKCAFGIFISGTLVLFSLVPWYVFCENNRGSMMINYGISGDPMELCLKGLFFRNGHLEYYAILGLFFALFILYEKNIINYSDAVDWKIEIDFSKSIKSAKVFWLMDGMLSVFGTILLAGMFSRFFFPILLFRYVYPSFILIWLIFAICIGRCKHKRVYTIILIVFTLFSSSNELSNLVTRECDYNSRQIEYLEYAGNIVGDEDIILTDSILLDWTILETYFPGIEHQMLNLETDIRTERNKKVWMMLEKPLSEEIMQNNDSIVLEYENGFLGSENIWMYGLED